MKDFLYLLLGILKIPFLLIKLTIACPLMLLAILVMVGKGADYPFNNPFGRIVGKILHGKTPSYYLYEDSK